MRLLILGAVLLALAGAVAVVALPSITEVGEPRDDVHGYHSGGISEVRVGDAVTFYVDEETRAFVGPSLLSGAGLVAMATACAMTALLLTAAGGRRRVRLFYAIAAAGLAYLAADQLAGIHETIGHNLPFLADLPGVERPDDVIFASYLIPTAVVAVVFRDVLRDSALAVRLFAAGGVAFVLAAALDIAGSSLDNPMELLLAVLLGAGLVALIAEHLVTGLQLAPRRASPSPAVTRGVEVAPRAKSA